MWNNTECGRRSGCLNLYLYTAFNVEHYLQQCIESLTLSDSELLG